MNVCTRFDTINWRLQKIFISPPPKKNVCAPAAGLKRGGRKTAQEKIYSKSTHLSLGVLNPVTSVLLRPRNVEFIVQAGQRVRAHPPRGTEHPRGSHGLVPLPEQEKQKCSQWRRDYQKKIISVTSANCLLKQTGFG